MKISCVEHTRLHKFNSNHQTTYRKTYSQISIFSWTFRIPKHLFDKKNIRKTLLSHYDSTMPHSDLGIENRIAPFNHVKAFKPQRKQKIQKGKKEKVSAMKVYE